LRHETLRTRLAWPDRLFVIYDYHFSGELTAIHENGAASGIGVLRGSDFGIRFKIVRMDLYPAPSTPQDFCPQ
jgi:hypothetical protein